MPQTIHTGIKALIDAANAEIETISAADAIKIAHDGDVVIVDIRDPREIERDGKNSRRVRLHPRHAGILDRSGQSLRKTDLPGWTRNSSSTVPAACARRSPPRPRRTWG